MRRCSAIYPELFAPEHALPKHDFSEQALPKPAQPQAPVPVSLNVVIGDQAGTLNMVKIRSHLVNSSLDQPLQNGRRVISARRRVIMLQALRWVTSNTLLFRCCIPMDLYGFIPFSAIDPDGKWTAFRRIRCICGR